MVNPRKTSYDVLRQFDFPPSVVRKRSGGEEVGGGRGEQTDDCHGHDPIIPSQSPQRDARVEAQEQKDDADGPEGPVDDDDGLTPVLIAAGRRREEFVHDERAWKRRVGRGSTAEERKEEEWNLRRGPLSEPSTTCQPTGQPHELNAMREKSMDRWWSRTGCLGCLCFLKRRKARRAG